MFDERDRSEANTVRHRANVSAHRDRRRGTNPLTERRHRVRSNRLYISIFVPNGGFALERRHRACVCSSSDAAYHESSACPRMHVMVSLLMRKTFRAGDRIFFQGPDTIWVDSA